MEEVNMSTLGEYGTPKLEAPAPVLKVDAMPKKEPKTKVVIGRRSPFNPLEKLGLMSPVNNKGSKKVVKGDDPMLEHNPLLGRLPFMLMISASLILVFLTELVFNKITFNGRCASSVLYPAVRPGTKATKPYIVEFGYGACEYNLQTDAARRVFFGSEASDEGWPKTLLQPGVTAHGHAGADAPNERVFALLGGLNANIIRNYDEYFRLFWSMFLHSSWKHLIFNVFCQIQALWIIEPDWGFPRTMGLFVISGIGGNLAGAVLSPCGTTVGSSGAMYGLFGAMIPYCIEYWNTIPRPIFLISYNIVTLLIGFVMGLAQNVDNYCHIGGCVFGLLWGFATIKSVSSCDKCTVLERSMLSPLISWAVPQRLKARLRLAIVFKKDRGDRKREAAMAQEAALRSGVTARKIQKLQKKLNRQGAPPCRMRLREWILRLASMVTMLILITISTLFLTQPELYANYRPPGEFKFSGWQTCECCFITQVEKLFNGNKDFPEQYRNRKLFWCFTKIDDAKHFCGDNYADTAPMHNLLESSQNAALGLLSTVQGAINSV
ncbi:Rhomboid-like protease 4 [Babesia sp. Xinjiang]|uniref:Rhomboid-like protease 4 n=1 Tax=Babesia sp. Xinjiang TaxID=462227 RepID=UPI000A2651AF|nr:Rhomboid-like protease 4 [Babesia sp. Xinjiang]ORM41760.1 Rhomboid-like protease 4 [Babesia sp. Xinjiang]